MNAFERLESAISALVEGFPDVAVSTRALRGSRDVGDQLILERRVGDGVRVVRVPASEEPVRTFYWGDLPAPGQPMTPSHGEGNTHGNLEYVTYFVRAFLFELEDWRDILSRRRGIDAK